MLSAHYCKYLVICRTHGQITRGLMVFFSFSSLLFLSQLNIPSFFLFSSSHYTDFFALNFFSFFFSCSFFFALHWFLCSKLLLFLLFSFLSFFLLHSIFFSNFLILLILSFFLSSRGNGSHTSFFSQLLILFHLSFFFLHVVMAKMVEAQ